MIHAEESYCSWIINEQTLHRNLKGKTLRQLLLVAAGQVTRMLYTCSMSWMSPPRLALAALCRLVTFSLQQADFGPFRQASVTSNFFLVLIFLHSCISIILVLIIWVQNTVNRLFSLLKNDVRECNDLYPTLLGHLASRFVTCPCVKLLSLSFTTIPCSSNLIELAHYDRPF